jgi:hypothetical protein
MCGAEELSSSWAGEQLGCGAVEIVEMRVGEASRRAAGIGERRRGARRAAAHDLDDVDLELREGTDLGDADRR